MTVYDPYDVHFIVGKEENLTSAAYVVIKLVAVGTVDLLMK